MAKIINCKNCDFEIDSNARRCLNCGKFNDKSIHVKYISGAIGILLVLIIFVGVMEVNVRNNKKIDTDKAVASTLTENNDTTSSVTSENNDKVSSASSEEESKKQDAKITYDNFLNIKMGESYEDVVALLGQGKVSSTSDIDGIKTTIYEWKESGISDMNVTIQNNVVVEKSQLGLESMDAKVTIDKYNQVQNGISYEELKKILGEGQILSEANLNDIESSIYEYINQNESNASFSFIEGKLTGKTQFNLE